MKSGAILVLPLFLIISVLLFDVQGDTTRVTPDDKRVPVGNPNTKVQGNPRPQGSPQGPRTNAQAPGQRPQGQGANLPAQGPRPKVQANPWAPARAQGVNPKTQAGNPNGQGGRPKAQSQGAPVKTNGGSPRPGGQPKAQPQRVTGKCPAKGSAKDFSCQSVYSTELYGKSCYNQKDCERVGKQYTCCHGQCSGVCTLL